MQLVVTGNWSWQGARKHSWSNHSKTIRLAHTKKYLKRVSTICFIAISYNSLWWLYRFGKHRQSARLSSRQSHPRQVPRNAGCQNVTIAQTKMLHWEKWQSCTASGKFLRGSSNSTFVGSDLRYHMKKQRILLSGSIRLSVELTVSFLLCLVLLRLFTFVNFSLWTKSKKRNVKRA